MKWFYDLKIATKLLIGFVIVALLAGAVGLVGIINIRNIDNLDSEMYECHTATMPCLASIARDYLRETVELRNIYINQYVSEGQKNLFEDYDGSIDESIEKYKAGISDDTEQKYFDDLCQSISDFQELRDQFLSMVEANRINEAHQLLFGDRATEIQNGVRDGTDKLLTLKTELAQKSSDKNSAAAASASIVMIIIAIIGVVLAVFLGIFISRTISKPVKEMVTAADKLSVGDIEVSVAAETKDEIGDLMHAVAKVVGNIQEQVLAVEKIAAGDMTIDVTVKSEKDVLGKKLSEMIEMNNQILTDIFAASDQVAAGAKQLSSSSQMLSQGSTEQASSVEEITSSMTQVAAQTKQNATNANQANELALVAKENAEQGNKQMEGMVKAMAEINEASAKIFNIIKVIDDIAFQTNLLALNAAVEAARAGQHGKGFAVVAEEVRNLAARSANAAKETTEMIENSIQKVKAGTEIAHNTAEALNKIVNEVAKAATLVGDIATASNEQASGIAQINQAIEQVAQVVQTNSAIAEESASASEELSSQADLLKDTVSRFKLKKAKTGVGLENSLNSEMIRLIEDIVDKKKGHRQIEQLPESTGGMPIAQGGSGKAKISLEDNNFGKY